MSLVIEVLLDLTTLDEMLSASRSSLSVGQGSQGFSTITVNPLNGFSGLSRCPRSVCRAA